MADIQTPGLESVRHREPRVFMGGGINEGYLFIHARGVDGEKLVLRLTAEEADGLCDDLIQTIEDMKG